MLASINYHRTNKDGNELGFTLIELLVVILIIGILASIAIPAFLNQRQRANDAQTQSDMKNANIAVMSWIHDNSGVEAFNFRQIQAEYKKSEGSVITIFGTPNDYCIKAWNPNGAEYFRSQGPYLVYKSITGESGNSQELGHASQSSCNGPSGTL